MGKLSLLTGVLAIGVSIGTAQNIVVNELVAKNDAGLVDPDFGANTDWIELYNPTSNSINISGYYLTDSKADTTKWSFPNGTTISAGDYLVVYADGVNSGLHTNFKLSSAGETLRLYDPSKNELDVVKFAEQFAGMSYGRVTAGWAYLTNITPSAANNESSQFSTVEDRPSILPASGTYSGSQSVSFSVPTGATVYYTTDGSNPTTSSSVYVGPFQVSSTTVVKGMAHQAGKLPSQIESATYLFGVSHNLPIVNITAENYQPTGGVNGKLFIDGKVKIDFIETNGSVAFSEYADFEVSGNSSADLPQIQGKVSVNEKYGSKSFDYKMYPNKGVEKFKSFLLRNASQDFLWTHMRDGLMSRIMSEGDIIDMPFEAYRPAVIYVNGKFEGQINVREDDDKHFASANYGQDMDTYQKEVTTFSSGYDITTAQGRVEYAKFIDLKQQRYYFSLFGFCAQTEHGGRIWRDELKQNQFKFHLHDWDQAFVFAADYFGFDPLLWISINNYDADLKKESLQFYAAQINLIYDSDRTLPIFEDLVALLRPDMIKHIDFTNGLSWTGTTFSSISEWDSNVQQVRTFLTNRPGEMIKRIGIDHPSETLVNLTHGVSGLDEGYVRIHDIKSTELTETGKYFKDMPLRLDAIAYPGYEFSHWTGASTSTNSSIVISLSGNDNITAVFVPTAIVGIKINEIQAKNNSTFTDGEGEYDDWVEFYNDGDDEINLTDCYLTDNVSNLKQWKINRDGASTVVGSKQKLILWFDKTPVQGKDHMNFKLGETGSLYLVHPDGTTILDQLSYNALNDDEVYQRYPDGSSNLIVCDQPTPNQNNVECLSVSVEDELNGIVANVYPNPTQSILNIESKSIDGILIINAQGKVVASYGSNVSQVDMSEYSNGVYHVILQSKGKQGTYNVIKH